MCRLIPKGTAAKTRESAEFQSPLNTIKSWRELARSLKDHGDGIFWAKSESLRAAVAALHVFFFFFFSRSCLFEAVAQRHSRIQAITLSGPLHSLYFGERNSSCCYLWPILEQQQRTIALRPHLTLDNLFLMWNVSAFCQVSRVRSTGSGRWLTCLFFFLSFLFCFIYFRQL